MAEERVEPDLINQFYRLIETAPGVYRFGTPWNNVVHGHDYDSENCMATMGAVGAWVQSGGKRRYSPADIRNNQSDFKGGIGIDDVQDAYKKLGLKPLIDDHVPWASAMKRVGEGRFVWFAVDYRLVPNKYQGQPGGQFDHAMGVFNLRASGNFDLYDPLSKIIMRNVPQSSIRKAAERIAIRELGSANKLFVAATIPAPLTGLVLRYGAVKTKPYPDKTKTLAGPGRTNVNVHSKPRTGSDSIVQLIPDGEVWTGYQVTNKGDSFRGSTRWYGNQKGTRWIHVARLVGKGGTS